MYVKRDKGWSKHWDFMLLDILCLMVAFYVGYAVRHGFGNIRGFMDVRYERLLIILIAIDLCLVFFQESYKNVVRRGYIAELKKTFGHCVSVSALMLAYLFVLKQSSIYSRESLLVFGVLQIILTYAVRCWRKYCVRKKMVNHPNVEQMLILTDSAHAEKCVAELANDQYRNYQIVGIVLKDVETIDGLFLLDEDKQEEENVVTEAAATKETQIDENGSEPRKIAGIPVVAGYYQIYDYLLKNVVDSVFICADMEQEEAQKMTRRLISSGVTVHISLIRVASNLPNRTVEQIGKHTVLTSGMRLATQRQLFLKRSLDILGGLVGVCITIVAAIFVGPIIYLQSPGPIFFKQERMGKNGRSFQIYKFRSMYMDAEERKKELMAENKMDGLMFKMDNDPRIIPIGRFIRKFSIDELPQFFNVLIGDMSLVGTRPPTKDEFEQYSLHHRGRLSSKPGITGLWQVSGRSDITDFEEVVRLDTEYIANWSLSEDIKILWKTVMMVVTGKGAE